MPSNRIKQALLARKLASRPSNSINDNKTQLEARDCYSADKRLPRKFQHPDDVTTMVTRVMDNKRARWKVEAEENLPVTRVYDLASEVPSMGGAVVGDLYRPSVSVITRMSKRGLWKHGTARG